MLMINRLRVVGIARLLAAAMERHRQVHRYSPLHCSDSSQQYAEYSNTGIINKEYRATQFSIRERE